MFEQGEHLGPACPYLVVAVRKPDPPAPVYDEVVRMIVARTVQQRCQGSGRAILLVPSDSSRPALGGVELPVWTEGKTARPGRKTAERADISCLGIPAQDFPCGYLAEQKPCAIPDRTETNRLVQEGWLCPSLRTERCSSKGNIWGPRVRISL